MTTGARAGTTGWASAWRSRPIICTCRVTSPVGGTTANAVATGRRGCPASLVCAQPGASTAL